MMFCKYCKLRPLTYFVKAVRKTLVDTIVKKWIFFNRTIETVKTDKEMFHSCSLPGCASQAFLEARDWGEVVETGGEVAYPEYYNDPILKWVYKEPN